MISQREQQPTVVTGCGRSLVTGRLVVAGPAPIERVTLRVGPGAGCGATTWVSLTADEAALLAAALLAEADAARRANDDA